MSYERLIVERISAECWAPLAPRAQLIVFKEKLPPEYDRIDFALVVFGVKDGKVSDDTALGYTTCRELDKDSVYLKHGGAFPPAEKTIYAARAYDHMLDWCLSRYKRITTLVENTNATYLKMALTAGMRPIGIRNFKGSVLVELFLGEE